MRLVACITRCVEMAARRTYVDADGKIVDVAALGLQQLGHDELLASRAASLLLRQLLARRVQLLLQRRVTLTVVAAAAAAAVARLVLLLRRRTKKKQKVTDTQCHANPHW